MKELPPRERCTNCGEVYQPSGRGRPRTVGAPYCRKAECRDAQHLALIRRSRQAKAAT